MTTVTDDIFIGVVDPIRAVEELIEAVMKLKESGPRDFANIPHRYSLSVDISDIIGVPHDARLMKLLSDRPAGHLNLQQLETVRIGNRRFLNLEFA